MTSSADAQYHVGNDPDVHGDGRLYRVYAGQLVMCTDSTDIDGQYIPPMYHYVPPVGPVRKKPATDERPVDLRNPPIISLISLAAFRPDIEAHSMFSALIEQVAATSPKSSNPGGPGPSTTPSSSSPSGGGSKGGGGGGGSGSSGAGSSQASQPALQAPRLSAIVSGDACRRDQIILPRQFTDTFLSNQSTTFVHVYWRSLADIFQYLGAVLRANDNASYQVHVKPDNAIATDPPQAAPEGYNTKIFAVTRDERGDLTVRYNGSRYSVSNPTPPNRDFTRQVLTIVSLLVNLAAQGNISETSAPVRLLPIP